MSTVKSFSVGEGDTFYIQHNSDNFTTIDCCLYKKNGVKDAIIKEIKDKSKDKGISRFISTHPDDDHISGLVDFDNEIGIVNFYRVDNETTKSDESDDFTHYCTLRDDSKKSFELEKGCSRKWMNIGDETRDSSGLSCLWPITSNDKYKTALENAKDGKSPNNISPAIKIGSLVSGASVIADDITIDKIQDQQDKNIYGVEMEIYGLYDACTSAYYEPIYFALKGVSDYADSEKNDDLQDYAANNSAIILDKFFEKFLSQIL